MYAALSMNPSKYPITLFSHVQIGSPYTAPSIVPITLPYQKHSSYPTCVPDSNPTTNLREVPRKNLRISIYSLIIGTL